MTRRVFFPLLAVIATAQALRGQSAPQPQPTFRVRVDAVELDASVTDARGNPVTDLTADDFDILEDGKPQTITSFTLVNIPMERLERPMFAGRAIESDVQSNEQPEGRLYAFVLDEVDGDQALRTRRFLRSFIERYFSANDVAAVSFLGRARSANAQGLTGSPRLLLESIDTFAGGFRATGAEAMAVARNKMDALRKIAESMAGIKGRRKMILLFSQNLPVDMQRVVDYRGGTLSIEAEDAHRAIRAATRGNVTIYPIDPRGLTLDNELGNNVNMRALASVTGGFALVNSNSFEQAFDRIVRENSAYYIIGYISSNDRRDGRYRRLDVRLKRPGLQVRARGGYLGPLGREPAPVEPKKATPLSDAVSSAIGNPVSISGLPLRVFAAPFKSGRRETKVALAFEIDGGALTLTERNGLMVGGVEVGYLATDAQNKIHPGEYHISDLSLKPNEYDRLRRGGFRVLSEMRLPRGRFQIRVAVGDGSGKSGSVVYDLDVPDFARGPLTMSGVALTSAAMSSMTTMRPKDPLKSALPGPITAKREFPRDDVVTVFAEIYEAASTVPHRIELTAELRGEDGRAFSRVTHQPSSTELGGNSGGYGFTARLPLAVEPGAYVIRVEAQSMVGERPTVSREILIHVR